MTSVNEDWFPKKDPRSGGIIYIWTLGQQKTPQEVAGMRGHDAIVQFLRERSPAELNLLGACMTGSGDYAGMVKLLLDAGATPPEELKDSDASPAVLAVLRQHGE